MIQGNFPQTLRLVFANKEKFVSFHIYLNMVNKANTSHLAEAQAT